MSEVMDHGVIGMPFDMAMHSDMSRRQFYSRAQALLAERDALKKDWQSECLKKGFEYVRESDDHYVIADPAEMVGLLRDLLGVDVRTKDGDDYGIAVSELQEQLDGLISTIYALEDETEALRKDAERYRWIRADASRGDVDFCVTAVDWGNGAESYTVLCNQPADDAIDHAMQGEQP